MAHPPAILTLNSGSSSIKCGLYTAGFDPIRVLRAEATGIGTAASALRIETDSIWADVALSTEDGRTHASVMRRMVRALAPHLAGEPPTAICHRIVHGGARFTRAMRITPGVRDALTALVPLAPNHLPDELALIDASVETWPGVLQVACFDTAFHHALPEVARILAVPAGPEATPMRRYGFHGLSYTFVLAELARIAGDRAMAGRLVVAHLGNGASLAAIHHGQPIDTSMGLTPAGGVVMSTRAGDLDPGVVTTVGRTRALTWDALDEMLTRQSGLLAISGRTGDMRELLATEAHDVRARLAVDVFCYQVRKWIGAFTAALGGLDTLVFTGGIGEHAAVVRARVCAPLDWLGLSLDDTANEASRAVISASGSRVAVRVIKTDEARQMARETCALLAGTTAS